MNGNKITKLVSFEQKKIKIILAFKLEPFVRIMFVGFSMNDIIIEKRECLSNEHVKISYRTQFMIFNENKEIKINQKSKMYGRNE